MRGREKMWEESPFTMTTEPIAGGQICILRYCWVEGPRYNRTATPKNTNNKNKNNKKQERKHKTKHVQAKMSNSIVELIFTL